MKTFKEGDIVVTLTDGYKAGGNHTMKSVGYIYGISEITTQTGTTFYREHYGVSNGVEAPYLRYATAAEVAMYKQGIRQTTVEPQLDPVPNQYQIY